MLTLQQVYDSSITDILTVSPSDKRYAQRVNDACRRLVKRGDFIGPIAVVQTCVYSGCVVWPRHVHHIRKVNVCNRHIPNHGIWHDWIDRNHFRHFGGEGWSGWGEYGRHFGGITDRPSVPTFSDIWGEGRTVRAYAQASADIGKTIQLFGTDNNGQPLRTQGPNGAYWTDGITLTLAAPYAETTLNGAPYFIRKIDRVIKQVTQMPVTMFGAQYIGNPSYQFGSVYNLDTGSLVSITLKGPANAPYYVLSDNQSPVNSTAIGYLYNLDLQRWVGVVARGTGPYYLQFDTVGTAVANGGQVWNETTGAFQNLTFRGAINALYLTYGDAPAPVEQQFQQLEPLAVYEPGETVPSYLKTQVRLGCNTCGPGNSVAAIVQLKHIDAVSPSDILIIDDIDALKSAVQAIQYEEDGERDTALEFWASAVDDLNRAVQSAFPEDIFDVRNNELGQHRIGRMRVF